MLKNQALECLSWAHWPCALAFIHVGIRPLWSLAEIGGSCCDFRPEVSGHRSALHINLLCSPLTDPRAQTHTDTCFHYWHYWAAVMLAELQLHPKVTSVKTCCYTFFFSKYDEKKWRDKTTIMNSDLKIIFKGGFWYRHNKDEIKCWKSRNI